MKYVTMLSILTCSVLAGCDQEGESEDLMEEVARIEVAEDHFVVFRANGDGVSVLEYGPTGDGAVLNSMPEDEEATPLELYMGLTDEEPPTALLDIHEAEAIRLRRADLEPQPLDIDIGQIGRPAAEGTTLDTTPGWLCPTNVTTFENQWKNDLIPSKWRAKHERKGRSNSGWLNMVSDNKAYRYAAGGCFEARSTGSDRHFDVTIWKGNCTSSSCWGSPMLDTTISIPQNKTEVFWAAWDVWSSPKYYKMETDYSSSLFTQALVMLSYCDKKDGPDCPGFDPDDD